MLKTSDEYFASRPWGARLGAYSSPQSQEITDRKVLDDLYENAEKEFPDEKIKRPAHWGGFLLKPQSIEFWQGRSNRLHDRIVYSLVNSTWEIKRLAP